MAGRKVSKRSAVTPAAPAAAVAQRRTKRIKSAAPSATDSQDSREARFVSKLAVVLQQQNARPVKASEVREALHQAVSSLPDTKALKKGLQDNIDNYAALLCRHLGVADDEAETAQPANAANKENATRAAFSAAATSSSAYDLLLGPCYEQEMQKLASLPLSRKQQLLLARGPAPVDLIRSCMDSNTTAMQLLEHSISLWSNLTPLSASEQREKGAHWEEVARLAGDALKEAASDEEKEAQVSRLLSRLFAAQAVRRRREDGSGEGCGRDVKPNGSGDLLLVRAQVMVCEEARKVTRECGGAVSPAALVPAIVRDLRVLGPSAWHRLVDLLLAPQLPLSIGTTSVNNAEELIWQAAYQAVEASQPGTAGGGSAPDLCPGTYIKRVLLHKRGMGRATSRAGAKAASLILQQCKRILPPRALRPWLQRQPQNQAVATALAALDRQPKDLSAHLLMRSSESEVRQLLKLWQSSAAREAAFEAEQAAQAEEGDLAALPAAGNVDDDGLFFVDTAVSSLPSHITENVDVTPIDRKMKVTGVLSVLKCYFWVSSKGLLNVGLPTLLK